jgi:hypothetical protein
VTSIAHAGMHDELQSESFSYVAVCGQFDFAFVFAKLRHRLTLIARKSGSLPRLAANQASVSHEDPF